MSSYTARLRRIQQYVNGNDLGQPVDTNEGSVTAMKRVACNNCVSSGLLGPFSSGPRVMNTAAVIDSKVNRNGVDPVVKLSPYDDSGSVSYGRLMTLCDAAEEHQVLVEGTCGESANECNIVKSLNVQSSSDRARTLGLETVWRSTGTLDWKQLGKDIPIENQGESNHGTVAMNAKGDRIVVGAEDALGAGGEADAGRVDVYQYIGGGWVQIGQSLYGATTDDDFGISVSMNASGNTIAVGAMQAAGPGSGPGYVHIYQENASHNWTMVGSAIVGGVAGDRFGISVALNALGDRVVIGASQAGKAAPNPGFISVYGFVGGIWNLLGSNIPGDNDGDRFGDKVDINAGGDIIAGGADDAGTGEYAKVYKWGGGSWNLLGSPINFGLVKSLSLNANGTRIALGDDETDDQGKVTVLQWNGVSWEQVGSSLFGRNDAAEFGQSVALNNTGDILAVGADGDVGSSSERGRIRVFKLKGSDWAQIGSDLFGNKSEDEHGEAVAINAKGNIVAGLAEEEYGKVYEYKICLSRASKASRDRCF